MHFFRVYSMGLRPFESILFLTPSMIPSYSCLNTLFLLYCFAVSSLPRFDSETTVFVSGIPEIMLMVAECLVVADRYVAVSERSSPREL